MLYHVTESYVLGTFSFGQEEINHIDPWDLEKSLFNFENNGSAVRPKKLACHTVSILTSRYKM